MRAEFDWLWEIIKAVVAIVAFVLFMGWVVRTQDEILLKDCEATGLYRAGETVIECKVLAERAQGVGS